MERASDASDDPRVFSISIEEAFTSIESIVLLSVFGLERLTKLSLLNKVAKYWDNYSNFRIPASDTAERLELDLNMTWLDSAGTNHAPQTWDNTTMLMKILF